jgi:hypothetical protein
MSAAKFVGNLKIHQGVVIIKNIKIKTGINVFLMVLFLMVFAGQARLFSKKLAVLPELMKPQYLSTTKTHVYITDRWFIQVYSLDTMKLIKKTGGKGEGPGQFKLRPMIKSFPDVLAVSDIGKFALYTSGGGLIKELRLPPELFTTVKVYPIGNNFVGFTLSGAKKFGKSFYAIILLDKNLNLIKELARGKERNKEKGKKSTYEPISDYFMHRVYGDRIYIADSSKGLYIEVFDTNGNKLYAIDREYEKIKISNQYKNFLKKEMDNSWFERRLKQMSNIVFKEYFPAIKRFTVSNGKIYVFTYKKKDGKQEIVVMDLKGKIEKRVFIKKRGRYTSISDNTYYYLLENESTGDWELHSEPL